MPRKLFGLAVLLGLTASPVWSDPTDSSPAATLGVPRAAVLGMPRPANATSPILNTTLYRGSNPDPLVGDYEPPPPAAPRSEYLSDAHPSGGSTAQPLGNDNADGGEFWDPKSISRIKSPISESHNSLKVGDEVAGMFNGINWFQPDRCFDTFMSPISNPFLAEDPRSLTEVRAIFMYQTIPGSQTLFHGGSIDYFGLQGRLAITDRLSVIMTEFGGISINPGSNAPIEGGTGLSEIRIGPKFTFYREPESQTIASGGLIFDLATGPAKAFQNTGGYSLTPFVSIGQKFWKSSYGEFGLINVLGVSFANNAQRSDYVYDSLHFDYDIACMNRFFAVLEFNWFNYTTNGEAHNLGVEGRDLANIGSAVAGRNNLSIAPGFRMRFTQNWEAGIGLEFPMLGNHDLMNFRLGVDLTWQY